LLTTNAPRTRWMSSASLPACQPASPSPAIQLPKPDTVKPPLTPKRPRRQVENGDYGAFARRVLRAYARRVGDGDVEALILMTSLAGEIDTAIAGAVQACAPAAIPGPRSAPGCSAGPTTPTATLGSSPPPTSHSAESHNAATTGP
jgi:hypothetical protein